MYKRSQNRGTLYDPAIPLPPMLIGREQDLARLRQHLATQALTAIHGLPGIGKTALAITLAYDPELGGTFSDGVLWAPLGPNPNLQSLLSRWGSLLGLPQRQMAHLREIDEWASTIRAAIGQRKMLLVIDDVCNLEQALTVCLGGPNCAHLVTTRFRTIAAHMAVGGATMIEDLSEEQSIELLRSLAPQVVSYEPKIAHDLALTLGGLPLALTLLGNFLRKQTYPGPSRRIAAAMERLSDTQTRMQIAEPHFPSQSHPGLQEHTPRSLQSIIAISDPFLSEPAKMALYTLSCMPAKPNTFSEEAALAVTSSTTDCLDELVDAGLLEVQDDERYLLHPVMADYGRLYLDETEKHLADGRLIAYAASKVSAHKKDYEQLELESNFILVALEAAHAQEKRSELIHIISAFASVLIQRGEYQIAQHHLKRAHQAAVQLNDQEGITETRAYLHQIEHSLSR